MGRGGFSYLPIRDRITTKAEGKFNEFNSTTVRESLCDNKNPTKTICIVPSRLEKDEIYMKMSTCDEPTIIDEAIANRYNAAFNPSGDRSTGGIISTPCNHLSFIVP